MEVELWKQILTGCVVILVFVAFVKEWFSPDLTAMGAFILLVLAGILTPDVALSVFGSSAPVTVAAMFIMSAVLERTGLIEALAGKFETVAGGEKWRVLLVLLVLVAFLSAFVNNTPVVVVFMPIVLRHCRKFDLKASRLLIPLSYAAIVGGTCTIIGTSTNLVVSGIAADSGAMAPFSMFEISKLGLIFVAITLAYLLLGGTRLIPDRVTLSTLFESESGREFLTQAYVADDSPLVGVAFPNTDLARRRGLRIIEVVRQGRPVPMPLDKLEFEGGDQILMKTRASGVMELNETKGIDLIPQDVGLDHVRTESAVLMEGILGPETSLVGKTLRQLSFRQRYGVLILAVHRRGVNLRERFEDVKLEFGDTLLMEGPADRMNELFAEKDFVNLSRPGDRPLRRTKAPIAIAALLMFMIGGAVAPGYIPVLAITAVLITLMTNCIDPVEAYHAVEWKVIFMIFGMLGLGMALEETKVAGLLAHSAVGVFGSFGPHVVLAVLYLLAALLTEMISNNAVAALLTPIAIGIGLHLEVDPRPFVIAIMFASSASFVTPIGYQTNTYVYGAGGYHFTDFARIGFPLAILLWLVASFAIPVFWPFR